jgi:penicillin amidase/acyl-homoserine-lactone acylase
LLAAAKYDATIVRDRFGVPHISGVRDQDAAFGLGYVQAEDDFPTVQRTVLAARGRLAIVDGIPAAESDYLVQLLGIGAAVDAHYESDLSPETRALLEGFAAGLNLYAAQHRDLVLPGVAPVTGKDIAALFMLRLPYFYGLDRQLRALIAGDTAKPAASAPGDMRGLGIAVAPARSADGATRLVVNPQGPFTGPFSWYEARIRSDEGWDMAGAMLPGSPVMMAGAGPLLGWAISANHPDLADIYKLEENPNDRHFYRLDGQWRRFETRQARIVVRFWGPIRWTFQREVLRSVQGPVIRNATGLYAIHYAGQDDLRGVEAFYRLNKAHDFESFTAALSAGGIPSLSFVYADKTGRIADIYNGAFPLRPEPYDWTHPVAGNVSATLWRGSLPFSSVPKTVAPASGFVVAANATPFHVTADPFNPKPDAFPASAGLETEMNNRTRRALQLLGTGRPISAAALRGIKFDACYTPDSDFAILVKDLAERNYAGDPLLEEAGERLRRYDLCTDKDNRGAALAIITAAPILKAAAEGTTQPDPVATLKITAKHLLDAFGRLDPRWGDVNRLRRGTFNAGLAGGPDTLRDIELLPRLRHDSISTARNGDSFVLFSSWSKNGRWDVESISPYGSDAARASPHYTDQAPLYARGELKTVPLTQTSLMAEATRIERPGKKPPAKLPTGAPNAPGEADASLNVKLAAPKTF